MFLFFSYVEFCSTYFGNKLFFSKCLRMCFWAFWRSFGFFIKFFCRCQAYITWYMLLCNVTNIATWSAWLICINHKPPRLRLHQKHYGAPFWTRQSKGRESKGAKRPCECLWSMKWQQKRKYWHMIRIQSPMLSQPRKRQCTKLWMLTQ